MTSGLLSLIVLLLLALFVIIVLVRTVRIVPQQTAIIVERLGRYSRTLEAGLHLLMPFVDRVRANVDLREQVVYVPAAAGDHLATTWSSASTPSSTSR